MSRSLFALFFLLILWGCEETPRSCFRVDETVEVNKPLSFTNCSTDAYSYQWWFDDGTESTEMDPVKVYTQRGKYKVYLTAFSKDGRQQSKSNRIITVANRFLEGIRLQNAPIVDNTTGQPIDADGTGPDYRVVYGVGNNNNLSTGEAWNLTIDSLPLLWPTFGNLVLTDEDWTFTLLEVDSFSFQPVYTWSVNPVQAADGGIITLNDEINGLYTLQLLYTLQ